MEGAAIAGWRKDYRRRWCWREQPFIADKGRGLTVDSNQTSCPRYQPKGRLWSQQIQDLQQRYYHHGVQHRFETNLGERLLACNPFVPGQRCARHRLPRSDHLRSDKQQLSHYHAKTFPYGRWSKHLPTLKERELRCYKRPGCSSSSREKGKLKCSLWPKLLEPNFCLENLRR